MSENDWGTSSLAQHRINQMEKEREGKREDRMPKTMRETLDAAGLATDLDAKRLRFCVERKTFPIFMGNGWRLSFIDYTLEEITFFTSNDDPLKCIDLAMRSVGAV